MRMKFNQPAPDQTVFAEDVFDSQIGKDVPVKAGGPTPAVGRVVSVTVAQDGRSVEFELELPTVETPSPAPGSFGWAAPTRP